MRLWFAPGSEVPLYRQMVTQVVLAIVSGDLKPGEKLPSTRSLARRFAIHANTVSAAYRQLEQGGWVESRRGSGVYVKEHKHLQMTPEQVLDVHIAGFLRAVRELKLPMERVRAQVLRYVTAPPPDHLLLIEKDVRVAQILCTELERRTAAEIRIVTPEECRAERGRLAGAVPLCRPSGRLAAQEAAGSGVEVLALPINSALSMLAPLRSATPGHLIAVVSHWAEFVDMAGTMLQAAGVDGEALVLVDATVPEAMGGLQAVSALVCDEYTALHVDLPRRPKRFVFPLLAESADGLLREIEATMPGVVTPAKVS